MIVVTYATFPQHDAPKAKGYADEGLKDIPCVQRHEHGDLFWPTDLEPH